MGVYDQWVNALFEGDEGSDVVARMRTYYTQNSKSGKLNDCTLRTKVSDVKNIFIRDFAAMSAAVHKKDKKALEDLKTRGRKKSKIVQDAIQSYFRDLSALREKAMVSTSCLAAVNAFDALPMAEQIKEIQRRDRKSDRRSLCEALGNHTAVKAAFAKLSVLPANVRSLRIFATESKRCDKRTSNSMLRRTKMFVPSAGAYLEHIETVLTRPDDYDVQLVIACLLAASGRRMTEVMSMQSTFKAIPFARGCDFYGQLKTSHRREYRIPLLVPFKTFEKALRFVKAWQGKTVTELTNKQISQRYQPNLSRFLNKKNDGEYANRIGGVHVHPHALRAIYMAFVLLVFDWRDMWDKRVAKYCYGHADKETTYHYDFVEIQHGLNKYRNSYGNFPLSEEELVASEEMNDELD